MLHHQEVVCPRKAHNLAWRQLEQAILCLKQVLDANHPFDYLRFIEKGKILLVGEGNLSFAVSLSRRSGHHASNIIATTFEAETEWQKQTSDNARILGHRGVVVRGEVDATKLKNHFARGSFTLIAFQFPNVASREPLYGRNPNHILIRRFLRCASWHLSRGGKVAITAVNSPYYDGVFDMEGAARGSGFEKPIAHPFRFEDHHGYSHVNTQIQDGSAVEKETDFVTFLFQPKAQIARSEGLNRHER